MGVIPDDPAARREWLERWATEQQGKRQRPFSNPLRIRLGDLRTRFAWAAERFADRVWDWTLDTSDHVSGAEHEHPDRNPYVPSPWHVLPRALRYLGVSDSDTFVEFGCGKGRVVHQAARRPFRRVIGVEISPVLAEIARTALAARSHQHQCRDVEIVVADVADFRVPDDLTIGYLFDPVRNETFDGVLRGIVDSIDRCPRRVRLIYVGPTLGSRVLATGRFRLVKEQRGGLHDSRQARVAIFEGR